MKDITRNVQVKFNQYNMKYQEKLTRPEQKFMRKFGYGLFRSGQVHITRIASSLEEDISKKKTCERLTRHLQKEDLGDRGAPKMYHPGALESVPPLNHKISRFTRHISGGSTHGKQVKDGTEKTSIRSLFKELVQS